jgi:7-cyano-7-deazaguanine synthase
MNKALVLLSGGQDSTTSLYWALASKAFSKVEALIIDYGQRHQIEIEAAKKISTLAKVPYKILSTKLLSKIGDSALLGDGDISAKHRNANLPASFVPGRNILFLTIAGMLAYKRGIHNIVIGVCQTDYSGYPDCRAATISAAQASLSLGMDWEFEIFTPMMFLSKKEEVILGNTFPGCMEALAFSHTCYEGQFPPCGKCPACILRAKGFKEAGIEDPLIERAKNEGNR